MSEPLTGREVVRQAHDDSLDNREPVALRGIIGQVVAVAVALLVYKGILEPDEGAAIGVQSDLIVGAVMVLVSVVTIAAQRARAYAPKTAAEIAVKNAAAPVGAAPTLVTPP